MIYTDLTRRAMALCYRAHHGQLDRAGVPYVFHPMHLAEQMPDELTAAAALLHDVAEDTQITLTELERLGYPAAVIEALALLTHREGTPYLEYVAALRHNPIARAVKLADLRHNTNSQLKTATERARFFVLAKLSEGRRTGGTLTGTKQSQSGKDGARIAVF